jgi:two-component system cell cycle response regulator
MSSSDRRALAPRPMIAGYCGLAGAATLAYGLTAMIAPRRGADLGIDMLATLVFVTIVAATRAWREPEERRMWSLVAACIAADGAAHVIYRVTEPNPLAFYPPAALACLLLAGALAGATVSEALRTRVQAWTTLSVLDALIAGLAVAAVVTATLARTTHMTSNAPVYLLLGITAGGMIVSLGLMGWRADVVVKLGATGLALGAASWALTAHSVAAGNYVRGGSAGTLFIASVAVTGLAAFFGPRKLPPRSYDRRQLIVPPLFAALALIVLLTQGADAAGPAGCAPAALAGLTLALVLARLTVALADAQRLVLASHDSLTDGLTGIGNRRRFTRDLERAFGDAADVTLALFDLDGFKLYNDTYGHPAGDALLVRIAARFAAVVGPDRAYRIGGDEFCTLLPLAPDVAERLVELAAESLAEGEGGGRTVTSSHGVGDCLTMRRTRSAR